MKKYKLLKMALFNFLTIQDQEGRFVEAETIIEVEGNSVYVVIDSERIETIDYPQLVDLLVSRNEAIGID